MIYELRCTVLNAADSDHVMPFLSASDLHLAARQVPGFIGLSAQLGRNLNRTYDSSLRA